MTQNMRRRVLLAGALAATGLTGIALFADDAGAEVLPRTKPKIALVLKSMSDPFTVAMVDAARNYQDHFSSQFSLTIRGTAKQTDTAAQIRMVEEAIRAKVNAIVIAPTDSKALIPVIARAIKAGIITITIDNPLDDAAQAAAGISVPFVGPNNRNGAKQVGQYLATRLKPGDQVGIIEGISVSSNAQQRTAGSRDAMDAASVQVVAVESGDWEYGKARDVATKMLAEHPQLRALLCGNDNMAMGAVDAIRDAGRGGGVYVTGYDAIDAIKPLLADGRVLATMNQFAGRQTVFGIDFALKAVTERRKQRELSKVIETPLQLVTGSKR
ncbi:ribose transport system substrate-binding protein [Paraburkholderia sp. HC6.4b]|uniref:substrate-binding domain-containing protein n=1 Tax=unclassified Paraburkholderia TaxID=2615204 RepID=UPI00161D352B|nr:MULTISPECIES: substrate-binding domain-containing protein [unclassified Paraburkholderia]MBB5409921.1 ribose transport system substrate-binding protein [Paraburkholderia sp. HC6.4b]MBB5451896.1 ribose transport system substrate-binding protein [Paraburkholderia sp. Kb1A]